MGITVSINAGADASSSSVTATGSVQHVITDAERTAFKIQDSALKNAVKAYYGKSPNDAYVCSPTPWNDLYTTYGWPQVQSLLVVQSAKVLGVTSTPTVVATQTFKNSSSEAATFNCGMTQEVSVTNESSWSNTQSVGIQQSISYGVSFLGTGASGESSLSYTQTWEQGGSQSQSMTLGTSAGVEIELGPGKSVEAQLTASKGTLTVQIVYQLTLSGNVALNYNPTYKGHHFWTFDVNSVLAAGGIPITITTTETIEIGYYANSQIVLTDGTGQTVASFAADATPGASPTMVALT
jgi:hypothetical protein